MKKKNYQIKYRTQSGKYETISWTKQVDIEKAKQWLSLICASWKKPPVIVYIRWVKKNGGPSITYRAKSNWQPEIEYRAKD